MNSFGKYIGWSILVHVIVILLLMRIKIMLVFKPPEFTAVDIISVGTFAREEAGQDGLPRIGPKIELPYARHATEEPYKPEIQERLPTGGDTGIEKLTPGLDTLKTGEFILTGIIARRKILHKKIPRYPEGYNIETVVKVEIEVDPHGNIRSMRLVKRGGGIFDRITFDALREWKFEPLPPNVEQVNQRGTVTFIYKLK